MAVEIVDGCKDHGGGGRGRGQKGQKYEEHEWNVFKGGPSPPSPFGISFPPRGHSGEEISLRGVGGAVSRILAGHRKWVKRRKATEEK